MSRGRQRTRDVRVGWRLVLAALFLAVAGAGAAVAKELEDPGPAPRPAEVGADLVTPVLSARRLPAALAAPAADRLLAEAIDPILARQEADALCLTVTVGSRVVYQRDPDVVVVPASLQKLLTATAALEILGPDHVFTTRIVAAAPPGPDGVVPGDAWLVGGGDPALATPAYAESRADTSLPGLRTPVEALADGLVAAGVTAISGTLLGDESRYDDDRYPDAWPDRFIQQDVIGPLSALTVDDAWVAFPPNPDAVTPDETPAADPPAHAAGVVAGLAAERGIAVGATGSGVAPPGAVELARVDSRPLRELLALLLRDSDNQASELLLKELAFAVGRPATTAEGAAVVSNVAIDLGLPFAVVVDGSGLSSGNRVTCSLVQGLLDLAGPDSPLAAALATAGTDGTLEERFTTSPVAGRLRAKTGTLNAVTALAGFLPTANGADASFAFVVNEAPPDEVGAVTTSRIGRDDLDLQQELVEAIDAYPSGPPLAELGPLPPVER